MQHQKEVTYILYLIGFVKFIGFNGPYGYSVIVSNNEFEILYAHVSPNFIVNNNDIVYPNMLLANVGPKYVNHNFPDKYHDSTR